MENPIKDNILSLLKQQKKDYLSLSQIRARLPVSLLRTFRIGKSSGSADLLKAIMPFFGNKLRQYKSGRSYYIALNISAEEMVMNAIRRRPGLSSKILCKSLPIPKKELMPVLNTLLETGIVKCNINETHGISLRLSDEQTLRPQYSALRPIFKSAYDRIGKGRGFVRIHQIREELGWSVQQFDNLLKSLMADYTVELHGGDPSLLDKQQIKNSFTNDNGILYITMTWWEK